MPQTYAHSNTQVHIELTQMWCPPDICQMPRATGRGSVPTDQRMPAQTRRIKNKTTVLYISCKLGTMWKGHIQITLLRVQLSQKRLIGMRKSAPVTGPWQIVAAPYFSCNSAGMLMFQPMACLSNPQVNRLHVGWSSLHAEQHTILLWPYYQTHKPELV